MHSGTRLSCQPNHLLGISLFPTQKNLICFILIVWAGSLLHGQNPEQAYKLGSSHFKNRDYFKASEYFEMAWPHLVKNKKRLFEAGTAHFEANQLALSIKCFEQLLAQDPDFGGKLHWALARSYHQNQDFLKAIQQYKIYYKELDKKDPQSSFIKNELLRCAKGNLYLRNEATALVENFGIDINTESDEYAVCPSINFSGKYYFSSSRDPQRINSNEKYAGVQTDIYSSYQSGGKWIKPIRMNSELNSYLDEEVMDFGQNGRVLFFFRGNGQSESRIFTDTFSDLGSQLEYGSFDYPMIAEIGDHAMSLFQDSILIFSSCRTGGYGGYDLYISALRNGAWTEPVNLGPEVNGPFNEDYPFLAKNGRSLYFSSDNLNAMGGYDIFRVHYLPESGRWSKMEHLSMPINSPGNDTHFKLTSDALAAVFSSDRKINNYGKRDIYLAYFKESVDEQIFESQGSVLSSLVRPEQRANEFDQSVYSTKVRPDEKTKISDIKLDAFYYQGDDFIKEKNNKQNLDKLISLLKTNTNLNLYLLGHSYNESAGPVNLYSSIKKADYLAGQITAQGISSSRVNCLGFGSSYPVARFRINGVKSSQAEQLNKRIEILLMEPSYENPLSILSREPDMDDQIRLQRDSLYLNSLSGLFYSIYLGDASSILDHPLISNPSEATLIIKNINGSAYSYYSGQYSSFREAKEKMELLRQSSVEVMGIHACIQQQWLTEKDIVDHVLRWPDLILYLDYLKEQKK